MQDWGASQGVPGNQRERAGCLVVQLRLSGCGWRWGDAVAGRAQRLRDELRTWLRRDQGGLGRAPIGRCESAGRPHRSIPSAHRTRDRWIQCRRGRSGPGPLASTKGPRRHAAAGALDRSRGVERVAADERVVSVDAIADARRDPERPVQPPHIEVTAEVATLEQTPLGRSRQERVDLRKRLRPAGHRRAERIGPSGSGQRQRHRPTIAS